MRLGIGATTGMRPKLLRTRFRPVRDLVIPFLVLSVGRRGSGQSLLHCTHVSGTLIGEWAAHRKTIPFETPTGPVHACEPTRIGNPNFVNAQAYFTCTLAPASSSFFLICSASSLFTPS